MRTPRILWGVVLRETIPYAVLGLLAVGSVLITPNLLRNLDDLAGLGLHFEAGASLAVALTAMLLGILVRAVTGVMLYTNESEARRDPRGPLADLAAQGGIAAVLPWRNRKAEA